MDDHAASEPSVGADTEPQTGPTADPPPSTALPQRRTIPAEMTSFRHEFPGYLLISLIIFAGIVTYIMRSMELPLVVDVLTVVGGLVAAVVCAAISTTKQVVELEEQQEGLEKAAAVTEQHIRDGETADALIVDLANIPADQWREAYRQLMRRTRPRWLGVLLAIVTPLLAIAVIFGEVDEGIPGGLDGLKGWVQWLTLGVIVAVYIPLFVFWSVFRGVIGRNKPPCLIVGWVDDTQHAEMADESLSRQLVRILADRLHIGPAAVDLKRAVHFILDEHGALHRQDGPAVDELIWTRNRLLDRLERGAPEGLLLNGQGNAVLLLRDVRGGHWSAK